MRTRVLSKDVRVCATAPQGCLGQGGKGLQAALDVPTPINGRKRLLARLLGYFLPQPLGSHTLVTRNKTVTTGKEWFQSSLNTRHWSVPLPGVCMRFLRLMSLLFLACLTLVAAPVRVTLSPTSRTITTAETVDFNATVTNTTNVAVTWSATGGSFRFVESTSAQYVPPSTPGIYTVTATSVADSTKKATGTVTVTAAPAVSVTLTPSSVTLMKGDSQVFTANVSNALDPSVTWTWTGASQAYPYSTSLTYIAGIAVGTYQVTATSVEDPTKQATATVTLVPESPTLKLTPTATTMPAFATEYIRADFTHTSDTRLAWTATGGTLTPASTNGVSESVAFRAPVTKGSYVVTATSMADSTVKASVSMTVNDPTGPTAYEVRVGSRVFDPVQGTTLTPYYFASGASASMDGGIGSVVSGTAYTAKPAGLASYQLKLVKSGKTLSSVMSPWIAPSGGGSFSDLPELVALLEGRSGSTVVTSQGHTASTNGTITRLDSGALLIAGGGGRHDVDQYTGGRGELQVFSPLDRSVRSIGSMARGGHTATLLPDGNVLFVGGDSMQGHPDPFGNYYGRNTWQSINPSTGALVASGLLLEGRFGGHSATLLPDGRVVIAGGITLNGCSGTMFCRNAALASIEVWEQGVLTQRTMVRARSNHQAILLKDGRVLFVSADGTSPEIFNPATGLSAETAGLKTLVGKTVLGAGALADGRVLMVQMGDPRDTLIYYDPATDKVTPGTEALGLAPRLATPDGGLLFEVNTQEASGFVMRFNPTTQGLVSTPGEAALGSASAWRMDQLAAIGLGQFALARFGDSIIPPGAQRLDLPFPVEIQCASTSVPIGHSLDLQAKGPGGASASVVWSVLEGSAAGTITSAGRYTAPSSTRLVHIVATSTANSAHKAYARILVTPRPAPIIDAFTADATLVQPGTPLTLSWSVRWATGLTLESRNAVGTLLASVDVTGLTSKAVSPTETTSYTLVAANGTGASSSQPALVQTWGVQSVSIQPSGTAYLAPGGAMAYQATVTVLGNLSTDVSWSIQEGAAGGAITSGGLYTAPGTTGTYHVVARAVADETKLATATVVVGSPATVGSFSASKALAYPGETLTLSWTTTGSMSTVLQQADLQGNVLATWTVAGTGTRTVTPAVSSTYKLTVGNVFGGESRQVSVTVTPVTQISVSPATAILTTGQPLTLAGAITSSASLEVTWTSTGGTLTPNGLNATFTAAQPGDYTVTMTAVADPSRSASATLTVQAPVVDLIVSPTEALLAPGRGFTFASTISVTGSSDASLTWSANGGLVLAKGALAYYLPPQVPGTYLLTATSNANSDVSASATVTVVDEPGTVNSLSLVPSLATVQANQRLVLGYELLHTGPFTGLDWSASGGQITWDAGTSAASFIAAESGTYTLTATSRADSSLAGTATVTVTAPVPSWRVMPLEATVQAGQSLLLEAVGASNAVVPVATWSVVEPGGGYVTQAGQYIAPSTPGTYHVQAVDPANSAQVAQATITVLQGSGGGGGGVGDGTPTDQGVTVNPPTSELPAGSYQSLSAVVRGLDDQGVSWVVMGQPATASVDSSGTFMANLPGMYTVKATSTVNPALLGTAVITVVSSVTPIATAPNLGTLRGYTVTALQNGQILIAGGFDGTNYLSSARLYDPSTQAFTDTPPMTVPRAYHTATLMNDGRVLLAGGVGGRGELGGLLSNEYAEVYNPTSGQFESLPSGPTPNGGTQAGKMRSSHATGVLLDRYETDGHGQSDSTLLGNNQVLIVGGPMIHAHGFGGGVDQLRYRRMSDLFTPGVDTFDLSNWVGTDVPGNEGGWALGPNAQITEKGSKVVTLEDGRALITGGLVRPYDPYWEEPYRSGAVFRDSKLFDPTTGFASAAQMNVPRAYHTMTKLADGRVLIVGGYTSISLGPTFATDYISYPVATASAELYDPATGAFTSVGNLNQARARHAAILLPSGKVLIVGGQMEYGDGTYSWPREVELFDPDSGQFSVMELLEYGLEDPKLVLKIDGNVFVAGMIHGSMQGVYQRYNSLLTSASLPSALLVLTATIMTSPTPIAAKMVEINFDDTIAAAFQGERVSGSHWSEDTNTTYQYKQTWSTHPAIYKIKTGAINGQFAIKFKMTNSIWPRGSTGKLVGMIEGNTDIKFESINTVSLDIQQGVQTILMTITGHPSSLYWYKGDVTWKITPSANQPLPSGYTPGPILNSQEFLSKTRVELFFVIDVPGSTGETSSGIPNNGPFRREDQAQDPGVWVEALRFAWSRRPTELPNIQDKRVLLDVITEMCYNSINIKYSEDFRSKFMESMQEFRLIDYINAPKGSRANCEDQAAAVQVIAAAFGVSTFSIKMKPFGYLNAGRQLFGWTDDFPPFIGKQGSFENHIFVFWRSDDNSQRGIFDACVANCRGNLDGPAYFDYLVDKNPSLYSGDVQLGAWNENLIGGRPGITTVLW